MSVYGESSTEAMAAFLAAVRDDDRDAVEQAWKTLEYWLFIARTELPDLGDPGVVAAMVPAAGSMCPECRGFRGGVPTASRCACRPAISRAADPQTTDVQQQDADARARFRRRGGSA